MTKDEAAAAQRRAGEHFIAACRDLAGAATELADAEIAYRLAACRAGTNDRRPPARELAADVLAAAVAPLRPYTPFVSSESGRRAAEALMRDAPDDPSSDLALTAGGHENH